MIRVIDGASVRELADLSEEERSLVELFRRATEYDRKFFTLFFEKTDEDRRKKQQSKPQPSLKLVKSGRGAR